MRLTGAPIKERRNRDCSSVDKRQRLGGSPTAWVVCGSSTLAEFVRMEQACESMECA